MRERMARKMAKFLGRCYGRLWVVYPTKNNAKKMHYWYCRVFLNKDEARRFHLECTKGW